MIHATEVHHQPDVGAPLGDPSLMQMNQFYYACSCGVCGRGRRVKGQAESDGYKHRRVSS